MTTTTINIRANKKLKDQSKKILAEMGLDMSSAIKLFLQQVVITKSIPFRIVTENGFTPEFEAGVLKASEEAARGVNVTKPMSPKEALEYLDTL